MFADPEPASSGDSEAAREGEAVYAIRLADVPPELRSRPEIAAASLAEKVGPDVRVIRPDPSKPAMLVYGRYSDPLSPSAREDAKRIRAIEVNGRRPFEGAVLVRERGPSPTSGRLARYDLLNARRLFGPEAVYTLQIGVYSREDNQPPTRSDLAKFRTSAEQAVEALRREGDQAFFYHGPNGSMVTVGIFDEDDIDLTVVPEIESPKLRAVRQRHPHNLLNGAGVRETRRGSETEMLQASRLVVIPD